jgi:hypothetical protein
MPGKIKTYTLYPSNKVILPQIETWVTPPGNSFAFDVLTECYSENKEFVAVLFEMDEHDNLKPAGIGCLCEIAKVTGEGENISFYLKSKKPFRIWENNGIIERENQILGKGQILEEPVITSGSEDFINLINRFRGFDRECYDELDEYSGGNSNRFFSAALDNFLPENHTADIIKLEYMAAEDITSKVSAIDKGINLITDTIMFDKGRELYKYEHYEAAIEEFKNCMDEENFYRINAMYYTIYSYQFLKKHAEAIDFFNKNVDLFPKNPDLIFSIASSYYYTGDKEGTAVFLQDFLSLQPHSNAGLLLFYSNSKYRLPESYKEFISDGLESGLSPYVLTEFILPLLNGTRTVTSAFFDELLLENDRYNQKKIDQLTALLKMKYDIFSEVSCSITDNVDELACFPKMYFYKDEKITKVLENFKKEFKRILIQQGPDEAFRYQFVEEGRILGYPECCINKSAEVRHSEYKGTTFEKDLSRSILQNRKSFLKSDITSLYAIEFYPCSLECEKAYSHGEKTQTILQYYDASAGNIYKNVILPVHEEQVLRWSSPNTYKLREYVNTEICSILELEWKGYDHLHALLDNFDYKLPF